MNRSAIFREQIEIYRRSFLEHGDSPRSTFNVERAYQDLRFERLMRPLLALRTSFSIHDVGAGLCDLHRYLLDRGIEHRFSATEIVPEMIELARRKYPAIEIHDRDLLAGEVSDRHDFVVVCGMFNLPGKIDRGEWHRFVLALIERMYEMATVGIAFNFLSSHRTFTDPDLHYMDPGELFDHCQSRLSRFAVVDHAYPLFECTIAVFRPEAIESGYDPGKFGKYFRKSRAPAKR
jgi:hypothetical protein